MAVPSVIGYMALCVIPRSQVCDEQGIGQWPLWKRFDIIKQIISKYVDEPYRCFLALPYHEIDKLKAEESFYWYTPRCDTAYSRLSSMADDHDYYKGIFDDTLKYYQSVVSKLKNDGSTEEANFLQLALKYVGESEDNIYCGDGRVVATVWGMRMRQKSGKGESRLCSEFVPEVEKHTVVFDIGALGSTDSPVSLKKPHGSRIYPHQVPDVTADKGYLFDGWGDCNPVGVEVTKDLKFTARYRERTDEGQQDNFDGEDTKQDSQTIDEKQKTDDVVPKHSVRFLAPDGRVLSQTQVEHGTVTPTIYVPPLPVVDGKVCSSWDADPRTVVINEDRDFTATSPQTFVDKDDKKSCHSVRFLNLDGNEMAHFSVCHGGRMQSDQIPVLPTLDGNKVYKWSPDPLKQVIDNDTDFTIQEHRERHWPWTQSGSHMFLRCLLYIVVFLLLVLLVLYVMYLNDPCSR